LLYPSIFGKAFKVGSYFLPVQLQVADIEWEGYPAPDASIRDWINKPLLNPAESDTRFAAFLVALFEETLQVIRNPESILAQILACPSIPDFEKCSIRDHYPDDLPGRFRLFMTAGQTFAKQGELRVEFYEKVIKRADAVRLLDARHASLLKFKLAT
jgi:hypothetical protein